MMNRQRKAIAAGFISGSFLLFKQEANNARKGERLMSAEDGIGVLSRYRCGFSMVRRLRSGDDGTTPDRSRSKTKAAFAAA